MLTESRSLSGTLQATAREYRILLSSVNGQSSGHLHNEVAPALHDGQRVLYLGDADLSGHDVEGNTRKVLEGYHSLRWERLAITRAQLDRVRTWPDGSTYTLWDRRIRKTDKRHTARSCCKGMGDDGQGAGHDAVETEALGQAEITAIVRGRLDELLADRGVSLADVQVRQQAEREAFRALLNGGST